MDIEKFRSIMENSSVDVWTLIETAISVAFVDHKEEQVKNRRDSILQKLYRPIVSQCSNCINEDVQSRIFFIIQQLQDSHQCEDSLVDVLESLVNMDITFKVLKETDIGRHVNRLRKHSSSQVRMMVKQLVRKWKELVDEWMRLNATEEIVASSLVADVDSSQKSHHRTNQNGHHQVPDFSCSSNTHNVNSGKKGKVIHTRETATKTANQQRKLKESIIDQEKLASARKQLHDNYQEAQNAKKQRTIQVMDLHDIPKSKNTFLAKNTSAAVQAKHW